MSTEEPDGSAPSGYLESAASPSLALRDRVADTEGERSSNPPRAPELGDARSTDGAPSRARCILSMVAAGAAGAAFGFVIGFALWGLLDLAYTLVDLIWVDLRSAVGFPLFPVVACTVGGAAVGLWTKRFGCAPKPLGAVLAQARKNGGYSPGPLAASCIAFLLPIAFGGSVGPEAGLTGLIAAGCTWVGLRMRYAAAFVMGRGKARTRASSGRTATAASSPCAAPAVQARSRDGHRAARQEPPAFSKLHKRILYPIGIAGGIAGAAVWSSLLGGMALPRFADASWSWQMIAWVIPLIAVGYALALLYLGAGALAQRAASKLAAHPILKPVLCGAALGTVALALPYVMFPGSVQAIELIGTWEHTPAWMLLATGATKAAFVAFCLAFGWSGGPWFPLVFCGISTGFGLAALTGIDPVLCTACLVATLLGGFSRKPIVAVVITLLCYPPSCLPALLVCAFAGAKLPLPKALDPTALAKASSPEPASAPDEE